MKPALLLVLAALCGQLGCGGGADVEQVAAPRTLAPYPNPFTAADPQWSPQPSRGKPLEVVALPDGSKAYVTLQGTPDRPGRHVVVVDLATGDVLRRVEVGSSPTGLALHPDGEVLVVLNRFSNYVSVIDTRSDEVVHQPEADLYAIEAAFTPDGSRLFLTNRWRDAVAAWDVERLGRGLSILARHEPGVPVGDNPRDLDVSADGQTVAVAALTGMTVTLIDAVTLDVRATIPVGAPVDDVAFAGEFLVVPTLSASTHHSPFHGPDTDGDGLPGDGTPNVNFQDLQNELAVFDATSGAPLWRYTSDTTCCRDYRDVDPAHAERYGHLLPPEALWIVGGALPEQVAVVPQGAGATLYVTYSGSNQVQGFSLDPTSGALAPGPVWATAGHNPHGVAVAGDRLLVVHRLGETLGVYDRQTGAHLATAEVGDLSGGPFPATDAEVGELINFVTSAFSVDGDQTCAHCHREDGNIDKFFSMPLTRYAGVGRRMTMAYRGAADTRPWFFESAMDESNFMPVINEFARIENFCCTDYTLWPGGAPPTCSAAPPAECETAPNPGSTDGFDASRAPSVAPYQHPRPTPWASRDAFYLHAAQALLGRDQSFGDGVFFEDPITEERWPLALDFEGVTRALGVFLLTETRLLPNPYDPDHAAVARGQALFESLETGCAVCHPAPSFAVSDQVNPFDVPLVMGPVVTPFRDEEGTNLDLLASGFVGTFPDAELESCEEVCGPEACAADADVCDDLRNVRFGVPSLRGIWDRAAGMLHDGRARGLREVLCTPGHPALGPGETGYNERDGVPDTHGGTSHLSAAELDDLVAYLLTL